MKSRTWPVSWQNRSYRSKAASLLLSVAFGAVHNLALAETKKKSSVMGPIESLETISKIDKKDLQKLKLLAQKNPLTYAEIKDDDHLTIHPEFSQSLWVHSNRRFTNFLLYAPELECAYMALLQNDLLKLDDGPIDYLVANYSKKDQIKATPVLISKNDYLKRAYQRKCFSNKEMEVLFSTKNLKKTLNSLTFQIPKKNEDCQKIQNEWLKNAYLPFLCHIPEVLKYSKIIEEPIETVDEKALQRRSELIKLSNNAKELSGQMSYFQKNYVQNLCSTLDSDERFCALYLNDDAWSKIISGEIDKPKMQYICQRLTNKAMTAQVLEHCATLLVSKSSLCTELGSKNFPALFPKSSCEEVSKSLNLSHLKYDYQDCPGRIDNHSISNIHRIIEHFKPQKMTSNERNCASLALSDFAKLNIESKNKEAWPLKLCFFDKIESAKKCRLYIPGDDQDNKYSEVVGVARALAKIVNAPSSTKCKIVESSKYNPVLLEYKNGCFITYDKDQCTSFKCPKKIIWNEKEIKEIEYVGIPIFDYFPNSFSNEGKAMSAIMERELKLKTKAIKNLTDLKFFLSQFKNGLIHGVGCAEDLYPRRFFRQSFNQCSPLPFLIDGVEVKNNNTFLSLRTSIDDIHSPRYVNWNFIYSAVGPYQQLHPLKTWTMYGIYK